MVRLKKMGNIKAEKKRFEMRIKAHERTIREIAEDTIQLIKEGKQAEIC